MNKWILGLALLMAAPVGILNASATDPAAPEGADRTGGPDAGGYRFIDNLEPNGPAWSFTSIRNTGTPAPYMEFCRPFSYCTSGPIDIGFPFTFYGVTSSVATATSTGDAYVGHSPIYVMHAWWRLDLGGGVRYAREGEAPNRMFVMEWYDVKDQYCPDRANTFQVRLHESGRIDVLLDDVQLSCQPYHVSTPYLFYAYQPYAGYFERFDDRVVRFCNAGAFGAPPLAAELDAAELGATKLSWPGVDGASGFKIYRGTSATGPMTPLATVAASARSFVDATGAPATTYYYQIATLDWCGEGKTGAPASAWSVAPQSQTVTVGNEGPVQPAPAMASASVGTTRVNPTLVSHAGEQGNAGPITVGPVVLCSDSAPCVGPRAPEAGVNQVVLSGSVTVTTFATGSQTHGFSQPLVP